MVTVYTPLAVYPSSSNDNNDIHDYNATMMMMMIVPNTILQDDGDSTVGATVGTNEIKIMNSIDVLTSMMMVYLGQR